MKPFRFKNIQIFRLFRNFLMLTGLLSVVVILLAFTTLPFYAYHWLGTSRAELTRSPGHIIMLGGSGMPSESNLIRIWYAAKVWSHYPSAKLTIAMPGNPLDSASTPFAIRNELILRGVEAEVILFENEGTNTRTQAMAAAKIFDIDSPLLLVTSPEHMRRAILSFRKAGFTLVDGIPAFENPSEASFRFDDRHSGGEQPYLPNVGNNTQLRYQIWNHLHYEVTVVRELFALTYYRLRGWI